MKGKITISRVDGGLDERCVHIHIQDELSGIEVVTVYTSLEQFAQALLGLGYVPVDYTYNPSKNIGKDREFKSVALPRPKTCHHFDEAAQEAQGRKILARYEKDGWRGCARDLWNHHNWTKDDKVRVGFMRFVEPKPNKKVKGDA